MFAILPHAEFDEIGPNTAAYPLPGVEENDDDNSQLLSDTHPHNPFGAVFFRRLVLAPDTTVPRMRKGPGISSRAFKHLFHASQEIIEHKYFPIGLVASNDTPVSRIVTNKTALTPVYVNFTEEELPVIFHLAAEGHELPPPPVDNGSDQEEVLDSAQSNIDTMLSQLWRQFLIDLAIKSPNPTDANVPSYCLTAADERLLVGEEYYQNRKLSNVWTACSYKIGTASEFETVFRNLFPPSKHQLGKSQNYKQCLYFRDYKKFVATTANADTVAAVRAELKKRFEKLFWIPHAQTDRIWATKVIRQFKRLPVGTSGPSPRILVRGKPTW